MDTLRLDDRSFFVDRARAGDVPALVALLGDDVLGREREGTDLESYARAFEQIDADPHHFLAAVRDESGQIVATLQLTLLPGLSRGGATRLQIEAVRIAASTRGSGLGTALFAWAHDWGRSQGRRSRSSPRTLRAPTRTVSTNGSAIRRAMWGSSCPCDPSRAAQRRGPECTWMCRCFES